MLVFYKYLLQNFVTLNILISVGICLTPKLSKFFALSPFAYNASNDFILIHTHRDLLHVRHPLVNVNYFSNKHN